MKPLEHKKPCNLGDGFTMKYETEETSPIAHTTKTATCEYQGKIMTIYRKDTAKTSARISNGFKYFDIDVTLTCIGTGNMS